VQSTTHSWAALLTSEMVEGHNDRLDSCMRDELADTPLHFRARHVLRWVVPVCIAMGSGFPGTGMRVSE